MRIKKSTLRKAAAVVGGLALISVLVLVVGPVVLVDAAEPTCGDGVCDTNSENNDLCPEDCQCIDNGVEDPGEGCGCKDVVCEDEGIASACGTPVGADGECPGNLVDSGGVCWDRCECQGICSEDDEQRAAEGGGVVDVCATFLTCDGAIYDCPTSCSTFNNPVNSELQRLISEGCINRWTVINSRGIYTCTP